MLDDLLKNVISFFLKKKVRFFFFITQNISCTAVQFVDLSHSFQSSRKVIRKASTKHFSPDLLIRSVSLEYLMFTFQSYKLYIITSAPCFNEKDTGNLDFPECTESSKTQKKVWGKKVMTVFFLWTTGLSLHTLVSLRHSWKSIYFGISPCTGNIVNSICHLQSINKGNNGLLSWGTKKMGIFWRKGKYYF